MTEERKEISKTEKSGYIEKAPAGYVVWRIFKPMLAVILALGISGLLFTFGIKYAYSHFFSPVDPENTEEIEITVTKGSSLSTISKQLQEQGVIRNSMVFKLYVDFLDMSSKLQSGKHKFTKAMTFDEIIEELKKGSGPRKTIFITLKEGWTVEEIAQEFHRNGFFNGETEHFLEIARTGAGFENYQFIKDALHLNEISSEKRKYALEGYLFCDKYEFYTDSSEETVINRLLSRFNEIFINDYVLKAESMGYTIDDVVKLASLIEKEAKKNDFTKVSSVFHNRMEEDMNLGSDASVQYYLGVRKLNLSSEELETRTLYNTYINKGLPLGPICQPSKNAIDAALYPDEEYIDNKFLFFCLSDPKTGELVYAKTYEEHLENVAKYRELWEEYDREHAQ